MGDNKIALKPVTWEGLKTWLPLILVLATLLVSLGVGQARISEIDRQGKENTAGLKAQEIANTEIQVRLARIENDIGYIRAALERIDKAGG